MSCCFPFIRSRRAPPLFSHESMRRSRRFSLSLQQQQPWGRLVKIVEESTPHPLLGTRKCSPEQAASPSLFLCGPWSPPSDRCGGGLTPPSVSATISKHNADQIRCGPLHGASTASRAVLVTPFSFPFLRGSGHDIRSSLQAHFFRHGRAGPFFAIELQGNAFFSPSFQEPDEASSSCSESVPLRPHISVRAQQGCWTPFPLDHTMKAQLSIAAGDLQAAFFVLIDRSIAHFSPKQTGKPRVTPYIDSWIRSMPSKAELGKRFQDSFPFFAFHSLKVVKSRLYNATG